MVMKITGQNGSATLKLVDGKYPEFSQIIPSYKKQYTLDKVELALALKELKPFVRVGVQGVEIQMKDNKFIMTADNKEENMHKELFRHIAKMNKGTINENNSESRISLSAFGVLNEHSRQDRRNDDLPRREIYVS